jgi:hypothetical protein
MNFFTLKWMGQHKWLLLLCGIVALLIISPISEVYDRRDDVITPMVAAVLLAVVYGLVKSRATLLFLVVLIFSWFITSVLTDGSGLFAGRSILAPVLFMVLLITIFVLLARWLTHAVYVNQEVLCAAICGYLLLGILWAGLYRAIVIADPRALVAGDGSHIVPTVSDLLYFSYTTLTTTGFGDYLPKNAVVRMLCVMEAIVGTFYNTIIIARFVGLYGMNPSTPVTPARRDDNL